LLLQQLANKDALVEAIRQQLADERQSTIDSLEARGIRPRKEDFE